MPREGDVRVSVVIPCYNYGRLLGAGIDSALAQEPKPCEVLIVDDGFWTKSKRFPRSTPAEFDTLP